MSGKSANSLKELRNLREAVIAEEKAKAQAIIQHLPPNELRAREPAVEPLPSPEPDELAPASDSDGALTDEQRVPEGLGGIPTDGTPGRLVDHPHEPPAATPGGVRAVPVRPPVPRPPAQRLGTKEPALIVPLPPKIHERLQKNVEQSRWSPADLVLELIRSTLHRGYPVIMYGDQVLARGGSYRTLERNPLETALKLVSGQGVFSLTIKPENAEYQQWLEHFTSENAPESQRSAAQICLFALQNYLESIEDFQVDGWIKHISTEAYDLERMV